MTVSQGKYHVILGRAASTAERFAERHARPLAIAIFLSGFLLRVVYCWLLPSKDNDGSEMQFAALSLAQHGLIGNIWGADSGPTAHVGALYPALLAMEMLLFGDDPPIRRVTERANAILGYLLAAYFAFRIARRLSASAVVPLLTAGFLLLTPLNLWASVDGRLEQCLSAAFLTGTLLWAIRLQDRAPLGQRPIVAFGALTAVALLFSPVLAPPIALLGFVLWWQVPGWPQRLRAAALGILGGAVIMLPWVARNAHALGGFVLARSNFGLELAVGNNDRGQVVFTQADLVDQNSFFHQIHPFGNEALSAQLRAVGELAYMRQRRLEAKAWIAAHPDRFRELTAQRIRLFWLPDARLFSPLDPRGALKAGISTALTLLAGVLILRLFLARAPCRYLVLVAILGFGWPYYVTHVNNRYRLPLLPITAACACMALAPLRRPPGFDGSGRPR